MFVIHPLRVIRLFDGGRYSDLGTTVIVTLATFTFTVPPGWLDRLGFLSLAQTLTVPPGGSMPALSEIQEEYVPGTGPVGSIEPPVAGLAVHGTRRFVHPSYGLIVVC